MPSLITPRSFSHCPKLRPVTAKRPTARFLIDRDLNELELVPVSRIYGQYIADAGRIIFLLKKIRFQRRRLLRLQTILKCAGWHFHRGTEGNHFRKVLGVIEREFLPIKIADLRMRFHDDPGLVTIHSGREGAIQSDEASIDQLPVFSPKYQTLPSLSCANQSS